MCASQPLTFSVFTAPGKHTMQKFDPLIGILGSASNGHPMDGPSKGSTPSGGALPQAVPQPSLTVRCTVMR